MNGFRDSVLVCTVHACYYTKILSNFLFSSKGCKKLQYVGENKPLQKFFKRIQYYKQVFTYSNSIMYIDHSVAEK